ncbi:MAG: hypothetical protein Q4P66_07315 [Actinomycetaceae bacterium]|nr:hypothetical protein [Actinomycetaceae bacterium]
MTDVFYHEVDYCTLNVKRRFHHRSISFIYPIAQVLYVQERWIVRLEPDPQDIQKNLDKAMCNVYAVTSYAEIVWQLHNPHSKAKSIPPRMPIQHLWINDDGWVDGMNVFGQIYRIRLDGLMVPINFNWSQRF